MDRNRILITLKMQDLTHWMVFQTRYSRYEFFPNEKKSREKIIKIFFGWIIIE